jgi:predicted dehydrogenase
MSKLRFAVAGTGFWANYQIPAWLELEEVELVALCDRTLPKAGLLASKFNVPRAYDDFDELMAKEKLDFIDVITDVDTHEVFTTKAAASGVSVVCQKPMAPTLEAAERMVEACKVHGVAFSIHENWRWQAPIRMLKELMEKGTIGKPFKARVAFCSAFPVFENQPFLAELEQFILTDIGSHILDVCRFLFGEAASLMCHTARINPGIKGEDVANVFMKMHGGVSCFAEMSYASILPYEPFPQTFISIEGENGSLHLSKDFEIEIATRQGSKTIKAKPEFYSWADPAYALVHSSIVDCNRNILAGLRGTARCETSGSDNFQTVRLVHAAYASAAAGRTIDLKSF